MNQQTNNISGNRNPPRLATRLLLSFLKPSLVEEVSGDLDECFKADLKRRSLFQARLRYWFQVAHYMRPFAVRGFEGQNLISNTMVKNYWKVTWRVMARQKMYAAINIGGFAVAIAASLLITLYVRHELSFDKQFSNAHRIYRVYRESTFNGQFHANAWMPAPLVDALSQYPEIEEAGHYVDAGGLVDGRSEIKRADRNENFSEDRVVYANQGLIDVLRLNFIKGNAAKALTAPHSVVITKSKADKYFPGEDAIGKALVLNHDEKNPFTITGIIEDSPISTHIRPDFILTTRGHEFWPGEQTSWGSSNYFDYVRLRPGTDSNVLEEKLHGLVEQYFVPDAIENGNDASVDWAKSLRFKLQPITDVHLNRSAVGDNINHGDIRYIWLFIAIASFIIAIASVNFVNLSTARSANRAKEVGLRKVVGSVRSSLIQQFLMESMVYCGVSFVVGYSLAYVSLPAFNNIVGTTLTFEAAAALIPFLLPGALLVGILAGLYPAFYLSAFIPAQILKGVSTKSRSHVSLRSVLVVFQYTISIALIIGTLVIERQLSYMMNKQLGFQKEQVLVLQSTHALGERISSFKNELEAIGGVADVSMSGFLPVDGTRRNGSGMWKDVKGRTVDGVDTQQWTVDEDYIATLGLKLTTGKNFAGILSADSGKAIVNKKLINALGITEPIGQVIANPFVTFTIIGVVEDFHFESMRQDIAPLVLLYGKNAGAISIKLATGDYKASVEKISSVWKKYLPDQPMRYTFLDESFAAMYRDIEQMARIVGIFTVLAIIVASLGLFALSAFTVEQRLKEIGIRIVMGASVTSIVNMLNRNFLVLVTISFGLAAPAAWVLMNQWLAHYAYRIELGWDIFVIASGIAFLISLVTITYQAMRAALSNPAETLRDIC
ncbi:ABC transporter permease [Chryseolinea sp. T2]|uniref:ABC transporter permease n=1 Tax=Chryseolinea sp. T2 TaxID=3129255 RepID=UPI0030768B84